MAKESKKLGDLFHDTLKDIYYAEKKILTALPKMAKAAQSEDLVLDPFVERVVVPDDAGRFERGRVAREARERAGLPIPELRQARPGHVAIGFERMTRNAGAVHALAARGIARFGHRSPAGQEEHCDRKGQNAFHRRPPSVVRSLQ